MCINSLYKYPVKGGDMSGFKPVLNVPNTLVSAVPGGLLLQTFVYNREGHASNIQFTQIPCSVSEATKWLQINCEPPKTESSYRMYGNSMTYSTVDGEYMVPSIENIEDFQDTVDDEVTACINSAVDLPKIILISKSLAKRLNLEDTKTITTVAGVIALKIL